MQRQLIAAIACVICFAPEAQAQLGFLDKIFEAATDVNASYLIGRPIRGNELVSDANGKMDMHGIGFEVALALGTLLPLAQPDSGCLEEGTVYSPEKRETRKGDTTFVETAKEGRIYPDSV